MGMPSAASQDWDSLLDPFEEYQRVGREKGCEEGEKSGYEEGLRLGRITATDYGMEIGFYRGCMEGIDHSKATERVRKNMESLNQMLNDFPTPKDLFSSGDASLSPSVLQPEDLPSQVGLARKGDSEDPSSDRDVNIHLQRIRARFKLLTVQLGISGNFSLKGLLEKAAAQAQNQSISTQSQGTSDW